MTRSSSKKEVPIPSFDPTVPLVVEAQPRKEVPVIEPIMVSNTFLFVLCFLG